jgi:hypothetical protein
MMQMTEEKGRMLGFWAQFGAESGGAGGGVTLAKQGHAAFMLCRRRRQRNQRLPTYK